MTAKQREQECSVGAARTMIETGWLCAQYMHGQEMPAWLHQTLAQGRQPIEESHLSVIVLPGSGRDDSLVVMTLHDFLHWSHRRAGLKAPEITCSSPCLSKEE